MSTVLKSPIKFNDPAVKQQMIAVKYRKEQEETRLAGIERIAPNNRVRVLEAYAGTGSLTNFYLKHGFKDIITNDINPDAQANYTMDAVKFIATFMKNTGLKIDLFDFDCYGCPAYAIQELFNFPFLKLHHAPFVICFSDGLGLWMKRNSNPEPIKKRYLIEGELNTEKIWWRHPTLIDNMFQVLAKRQCMTAKKIITVQTKHKNYVLGSYEFNKI